MGMRIPIGSMRSHSLGLGLCLSINNHMVVLIVLSFFLVVFKMMLSSPLEAEYN